MGNEGVETFFGEEVDRCGKRMRLGQGEAGDGAEAVFLGLA